MNQSSSNGESYSVFISHSHADGQAALSLRQGLFNLAEKPCFFSFDTVAPEPSRPLMHSLIDRVHGMVVILGAGCCGKTTRLSWLARAQQGGRREALIRALASPGGTISDPYDFEWGRIRLFDSMSYRATCFSSPWAARESWTDSSLEDLSEEIWEQRSGQSGTEEGALFSWTRASREGFLLNRLLSYPQSELLKFGEGVHGLGGLPSAFQLAWELLYRKMSAKARLRIAAPTIPDDRDASVLSWATTLAHWHGCEVMVDDEPDLKGCLVATRDRLVIHLSSLLDARTRRFALLHELAHHLLRHTPNTEYGLDPAVLAPDLLWSFKRQERTADALASIWSYLLEGLDAIVMEIVRRGKAWLPAQSQLCLPLSGRANPRPVERSDTHYGGP